MQKRAGTCAGEQMVRVAAEGQAVDDQRGDAGRRREQRRL